MIPPHVDESAFFARLARFEIETPSWGYADTGTRFGKFLQPAAATTIEEKLADAAQVHKYTGCCPSVAVHVLWDFPVLADGRSAGPPCPAGVETPGPAAVSGNSVGHGGPTLQTAARAVAETARRLGLRIGSINPNLFQDQCYKWGSLTNRDPAIRARAMQHIRDCLAIGRAVDLIDSASAQEPSLHSASGRTSPRILNLWLADGTNYPGQASLRERKRLLREALCDIHDALPTDWTMLIEYKPFEPAFYHTDIADWGMACAFARHAGPRAKVLVDTGHHLPGANIEHIVAFLIDEDLLGGFHFNDRKYADDDLTMGSIDPYQLFRIFHEITAAEHERRELRVTNPELQVRNSELATRNSQLATRNSQLATRNSELPDLPIAYMVDQSHNLKPKIEAMIQTVMTAQEHFAKALLVDHAALARARQREDLVASENILRDAFATDVRPLLADWRQSRGLPPDPLAAFRESGYTERVARERGARKVQSTQYA
ncbi:MAG: TIM barrel protein [Planctomycetota bacterium]